MEHIYQLFSWEKPTEKSAENWVKENNRGIKYNVKTGIWSDKGNSHPHFILEKGEFPPDGVT